MGYKVFLFFIIIFDLRMHFATTQNLKTFDLISNRKDRSFEGAYFRESHHLQLPWPRRNCPRSC